MKKLHFLLVIALVAMMVSCKQEEQKAEAQPQPTEEKEALKNPMPAKLQTLRLGQELAIYGYENESAEALIEAANILSGITTGELQAIVEQEEGEGEKAEKSSEERSFAPEALLAKAKEIAGEDANLLALIQKVEAKLATPVEGERGANLNEEGKTAVSECPARGCSRYTVEFREGELAECAVVGDGDTDLDLFIYDQNGNLVASDTDYTDNCYCSWTPKWTGNFILKIVNRGPVHNRFTIAVN